MQAGKSSQGSSSYRYGRFLLPPASSIAPEDFPCLVYNVKIVGDNVSAQLVAGEAQRC